MNFEIYVETIEEKQKVLNKLKSLGFKVGKYLDALDIAPIYILVINESFKDYSQDKTVLWEDKSVMTYQWDDDEKFKDELEKYYYSFKQIKGSVFLKDGFIKD